MRIIEVKWRDKTNEPVYRDVSNSRIVLLTHLMNCYEEEIEDLRDEIDDLKMWGVEI